MGGTCWRTGSSCRNAFSPQTRKAASHSPSPSGATLLPCSFCCTLAPFPPGLRLFAILTSSTPSPLPPSRPSRSRARWFSPSTRRGPTPRGSCRSAPLHMHPVTDFTSSHRPFALLSLPLESRAVGVVVPSCRCSTRNSGCGVSPPTPPLPCSRCPPPCQRPRRRVWCTRSSHRWWEATSRPAWRTARRGTARGWTTRLC